MSFACVNKKINLFLTNSIFGWLSKLWQNMKVRTRFIVFLYLYVQGTIPYTAAERRKSEAAIRENTPEANFDSSGPEDDALSDEDKAARVKRRLVREVKFLKGKLDRLKIKEHTAKNERQAIQVSMKKNQLVLR